MSGRTATAAPAPAGVLELFVNEGFAVMVDDSVVYHRGFGDRPTARDAADPSLTIAPRVITRAGTVVSSRTYPLAAAVPPHGRPKPLGPDPAVPGHYLVKRAHWASFFPRRTIVVESGARIRLRLHNGLREPHALRVPGVLDTGPVAPGRYVDVDVAAPAPGSYLYLDPTNAPVERTLGLHGAMIVVPQDPWRLSEGGVEFERQWVWLCHNVDPVWAAAASAGRAIDPVRTPPVPRYFTLNDRSGFRSIAVSTDEAENDRAHEDTLPSGYPREIDVRNWSRVKAPGSVSAGQLVRVLNSGVVVHQMHFHGNHVWMVRRDGVDLTRNTPVMSPEGHLLLQMFEDVVESDPLGRTEVVLPVRRPPDVIDEVWSARAEDWIYPMHCHAEPSQSAAGGLYPGGLVADWTLAGEAS